MKANPCTSTLYSPRDSPILNRLIFFTHTHHAQLRFVFLKKDTTQKKARLEMQKIMCVIAICQELE